MHIAIENDFLYNGAQRIAYLRICLEQTQDNICGRIQTESNVRFEVDMEIKQWRMLTGQSICVLLLLLVFCVIFSKEMPIDSISKVQAQEAKESVLSESTRTRAQKLSDPKQDDASKKSQYVIVLDAGHGGKDEGAVSDDGKLEEKEYNLAVVKEIARLLEQSGVKVYCTRTTDRTVSKKARVRLANKRQADMLVSVHCNASDARKHFVRGIEVLYSKRDNGAGYTCGEAAQKDCRSDRVACTWCDPQRRSVFDASCKSPGSYCRNRVSDQPFRLFIYAAGKRNKADRLGNLSGSDGDIREILERLSRNGTFVSLILERNQ